jgi:PPOX class probable F420-dependent enzyme
MTIERIPGEHWMSRRDLIQMSADEVDAFLAEAHLCAIGTHGPRGTIHLVAMNYGFLDGAPAFWSYRKSQKVVNLERDPTVSMLVHSGYHYRELRGVQIIGTADIRDDVESVRAVAESMGARYGPGSERNTAQKSIPKRVAVRIVPGTIISWDHTKLGGEY